MPLPLNGEISLIGENLCKKNCQLLAAELTKVAQPIVYFVKKLKIYKMTEMVQFFFFWQVFLEC